MLLGVALVLCHSGVQASELSDRLSTDRYVLLMRHALAPGVGDPPGYSLARCESQRILNDEGKRQAVRIGQWLRSQGIAQASVYTSAWCRCTQTAELLGLGPVVVEPSLASFFDEPHLAAAQNKKLQAFIAQALRAKKDRALILVTHHVNILEFMGQNIGSGDMVLAHVNAQGRLLDYKRYPSP
jgi:phosphohistidine phosphatase SixA